MRDFLRQEGKKPKEKSKDIRRANEHRVKETNSGIVPVEMECNDMKLSQDRR